MILKLKILSLSTFIIIFNGIQAAACDRPPRPQDIQKDLITKELLVTNVQSQADASAIVLGFLISNEARLYSISKDQIVSGQWCGASDEPILSIGKLNGKGEYFYKKESLTISALLYKNLILRRDHQQPWADSVELTCENTTVPYGSCSLVSKNYFVRDSEIKKATLSISAGRILHHFNKNKELYVVTILDGETDYKIEKWEKWAKP
jgi:hypothetical protein